MNVLWSRTLGTLLNRLSYLIKKWIRKRSFIFFPLNIEKYLFVRKVRTIDIAYIYISHN